MLDKKSEAIRLFLVAAKCGTFKEAARQTGIPPLKVTRTIQALEENLGFKLFHRTTRSIRLTEEGKTYEIEAARILGELNLVEQELREACQFRGKRLRVLLPWAYGQLVIAPLLREFQRAEPDLQLDLEFSNRPLDGAWLSGIDLIIRASHFEAPKNLTPVGSLPTVVRHFWASPAFLKKYGRPTSLEELAELPFAVNPRTNPDYTFTVLQGGEKTAFQARKVVFRSNNLLEILNAAAEGIGIAFCSETIVRHSPANGKLVHILPSCHSPPTSVYILRPNTRGPGPLVRSLLDFLSKHLAVDVFI